MLLFSTDLVSLIMCFLPSAPNFAFYSHNFRLDFTYNHNNWGVGLPPQEKNEKNWPL